MTKSDLRCIKSDLIFNRKGEKFRLNRIFFADHAKSDSRYIKTNFIVRKIGEIPIK